MLPSFDRSELLLELELIVDIASSNMADCGRGAMMFSVRSQCDAGDW